MKYERHETHEINTKQQKKKLPSKIRGKQIFNNMKFFRKAFEHF